MKDMFGHNRGACKTCTNCNEFISHEDTVRCHNCGCKPVAHEKLENEVHVPSDHSIERLSSIQKYETSSSSPIQIYEESETSSSSPIQIYEESETSSSSPIQICEESDILPSSPIQIYERSMYDEPMRKRPAVCDEYDHRLSPMYENDGSVCGFPGCHGIVDFDINTGREFSFCSSHNSTGTNNIMLLPVFDKNINDMIIEDIESDSETGNINDYYCCCHCCCCCCCYYYHYYFCQPSRD